MKFIIVLVAVALAQVNAGTINNIIGDAAGDVSGVAVAGEKIWHNIIANMQSPYAAEVEYQKQPTTKDKIKFARFVRKHESVISEIRNEAQEIINEAHQLVNKIHNIIDNIIGNGYEQPEPANMIEDGALIIDSIAAIADIISHIVHVINKVPQPNSLNSDGASIIAEERELSAQAIAALSKLLNKMAQPNSIVSDGSSIIAEEGTLSAQAIAALGNLINKLAQPQNLGADGAAIIGELGGISAQTIAKAANAAAPYVKQIDQALGDGASDLGNIINHLVPH